MKPLKLKMEAFGSYGRATEIDFTLPNQNLFLITGDTGAGKTTIFDAIVFALYGETSTGSKNGKKSGLELQSQFIGLDVKPFVELTFEEKGQTYIVERIPQHQSWKKGKKELKKTPDTEKVSLIMPDGTDYANSIGETNQKIEEIVGLSKEQFMQVGMIAQGEFMELLRASSDSKKEIFRKLFNTQLFKKVVDELAIRKKDKEKTLNDLKIKLQTEVSHVLIPNQYDKKEEIQEISRKITTQEDISISLVELFVEQLEKMCQWQQEEGQKAKIIKDEAAKKKDAVLKEKTMAKALLEEFDNYSKNKQELEKLKEQEEQIIKLEKSSKKILSAYEILPYNKKLEESKRKLQEIKKRLEDNQNLLPKYKDDAIELETLMKEARKQAEDEQALFAILSEKVEKNVKSFSILKEIDGSLKEAESALKQAENNKKAADEKLEQQEIQIKKWKEQKEIIKDAKIIFSEWQVRQKENERIRTSLKEAIENKKQIVTQVEELHKKREEYKRISTLFSVEQEKYNRLNRAFLNNQAGVLAKGLEVGKPCPVCGALEHPNPFVCSDGEEIPSQEQVQELESKVSNLNTQQAKLASECNVKNDNLKEFEETYYREIDKIVLSMKEFKEENIFLKGDESWGALDNLEPCIQENISESDPRALKCEKTVAQLKTILNNWYCCIDMKKSEIVKNVKQFEELETNLAIEDNLRQKVRENVDICVKALHEKENVLASLSAHKESLEENLEFNSKEEALKEKDEADRKLQEKIKNRQDAEKRSNVAKSLFEKTQTIINADKETLPKLTEECQNSQKEYENILLEKNFDEKYWKKVTQEYTRENANAFDIKAKKFWQNKAALEKLLEENKKKIQDKECPDMEKYNEKLEAAQTKLAEAEEEYNSITSTMEGNLKVLNNLKPQIQQRSEVLEQQERLSRLYSIFAGNVSGSRMDLETFVQRRYLEQILGAANRRFEAMSAGQFELQMVDIEQSGKGKNRGLDLMVYSNITGKSREIRTLSGGESFMAALALALGMADEIQANSASINLDVMFIDEGFGSLDDHSREQAIRVLKEMAGGSKLIGIISHVTELKQEIDDQLIVKKDENGSRVEWEL